MFLFHFTPYFFSVPIHFFHFFLILPIIFLGLLSKKQKSRRNFSGGWILSGQGPDHTLLIRIRTFRAVN
jgi:hypothetical protein